MLKRLVFTLFAASPLAASAQLTPPVVEVGAGMALRHTEGFYIPRFSVAGHKIFKGLGLYASYEQRNNVVFSDDFNGDGNYQRYVVGPTLYLNPVVYAYGGISPFGPYGLGGEGGFGKVRKEIGMAYVFKPFTLHAGYSNWVGFTTGVGYTWNLTKAQSRTQRELVLAKTAADPTLAFNQRDVPSVRAAASLRKSPQTCA